MTHLLRIPEVLLVLLFPVVCMINIGFFDSMLSLSLQKVGQLSTCRAQVLAVRPESGCRGNGVSGGAGGLRRVHHGLELLRRQIRGLMHAA